MLCAVHPVRRTGTDGDGEPCVPGSGEDPKGRRELDHSRQARHNGSRLCDYWLTDIMGIMGLTLRGSRSAPRSLAAAPPSPIRSRRRPELQESRKRELRTMHKCGLTGPPELGPVRSRGSIAGAPIRRQGAAGCWADQAGQILYSCVVVVITACSASCAARTDDPATRSSVPLDLTQRSPSSQLSDVLSDHATVFPQPPLRHNVRPSLGHMHASVLRA